MKQYYYIYMTINSINGKRYVGKHIGKLNDNYLGSGFILKQAINKYGKNKFFKIVLKVVDSKKELDIEEINYIQKYKATTSAVFYNITKGGAGGLILLKNN